jgi:CBS domain containing-hemolysin-like protein
LDIGSILGLSAAYSVAGQTQAPEAAAPSFGIYGLVAVLVLVALNGFFVAAEFSLVSVRRSRIEQLVSEGSGGAKAVQRSILHLNNVIASTQVGITLASLALGWVGEPAVTDYIRPVMSLVLPGGENGALAHTIGLIVSFILITTFHIVMGELVPKTISLQKTENVAMFVARPLEIFRQVFRPFIWVINGLGSIVIHLLGMQVLGENAKVHSVDELEILVKESREAGFLDKDEEVLLHRVFDFGDKTARQVMLPRTEVVGVPDDARLDTVLKLAANERYTRFPVYHESLDRITGVVHVKDLFGLMSQGFLPEKAQQTFKLSEVVRPVLTVPETLHVADLLTQMRLRQVHMAILIDEYGGTAGIVTLEDILEEIIGDVRDEFDTTEGGVQNDVEARPDGTTLVSGLFLLQDAIERFNLEVPEEELDEYDTLGGYIQGHLGRVPQVGDAVNLGNYRLVVEEMDGLRVDRISFIPVEAQTPPAEPATHQRN